MHVELISDPKEFGPKAGAFLLRHEAENNLMLGLFEHLLLGRREGQGEPALYVVYDDDNAIVGAALWAGFHLILTRGTPASHAALADYLASRQIRYPKASGPASEVSAFALADLSRTSRPHAPGPVMRLMQTMAILAPPMLVSGSARFAREADLATAVKWSAAFVVELNMEVGDRSSRIRKDIADEKVVLWCDPEPASMAVIVGRTPNGARIGAVYTPPEMRRRGYASACVADLARRLFEQGRTFVYLYAEATNKTSNHIYESIGFEPVTEWQQFDLNPATSVTS